MKIKINSHEAYEIQLPETIGKDELISITERFEKLIKFLGKDELMAGSPEEKSSKVKKINYPAERKPMHRREWARDKNIVIKLLKIHYLGTKEQKEAIAKELKTDWNDNIMRSLTNLTKRHKIQSKEIGLKKFPTRETFGDFKKNKDAWRI